MDDERRTSASRRATLVAGAALLAGLAGCGGRVPAAGGDGGDAGDEGDGTGGSATATPTSTGGTETGTSPSGLPAAVGAERVASGFVSPVDYAPVGSEGLALVADQPGRLYRVGDGTATVVADLRDRVVDVLGGYDERGLLGLAVHPDFPDDDRLFVRYSAPARDGAPSGTSHAFVLSEFDLGPDGAVDVASERVLLELDQPQSNHNAGAVAFGPDGHLYVGVGDGGGANDVGGGHVPDWYDAVEGGNGQDVTENLLGSVLRLDVDDRGDEPYRVPDDNPLVGREGLDEQYAWGLRNPWRFSFSGGDLLVADVGQNRFEEINRVVAGGNYGWNVREGPDCFRADDCPTAAPDGTPLRDPVVSYPHGGAEVSGLAVVGGYVADGAGVPGLDGRYVFADWRSEGRLFVAEPTDADGEWPVSVLPLADDADVGRFVLAFGRDADGALVVCSSRQGGVTGSTGAVHRLVPA
jgi:glucose/arabinose dehydrogenase